MPKLPESRVGEPVELSLHRLLPSSLIQEKQTKEVLTRKQQKCRRKNQDEESQEPPELLKRPREYTVRFTFPDPPPLSPPVLGLHGE